MRIPLLADLLRDVSLPHWREHRLRTLLTVLGVALGVASVVGMADVSATVLASFRRMVDTISGDTLLEIVSASGTVAESLVEEAAKVTGVGAAGGIVEGFVPIADHPDETLYLLGVDFLGSPVWATQFPRAEIAIDDELEFLSRLDSVMLTRELMTRHGWSAGDTVTVLAPSGPAPLEIRGVLGSVAPARLFGGAVAVMDLPAAQRLLGREARVDRIALQLAPDTRLDTVEGALRAALGPSVEVSAPEARGRQAEDFLFSLRTMLATMSACAVIVGTLIVFHTMAVSVQQRRREFALLNVAGVSPRRIVRLCLVETVLLAALGVVLGLGGGWLLGRLGGQIVGEAVSDIWLRVDVAGAARSGAGEVIGVVSAVVTALVASYLAIRATFTTTTVEALRPTGFVADERPLRLRALLVPALVAASSWLILVAPPGLGFVALVAVIVAACCLAYLGGALIAPALVLLAGRATQWLEPRVPWFPVRMALDNLPRDPRRSGATVGTIIVAMAIAANVAGTVESFNHGALDWIDQYFAADLFVGAGDRVQLYGGNAMGAEVADTLRAVPGVGSVEPFRVRRIRLGDQPAFLQGISLAERLAHGGLPMVEGRLEEAAVGLRAGTGVLLSDNLAFRRGLHRGDTVALVTPQGDRAFRVEGTYTDYVGARDLGAVVVDDALLTAVWDDRLVNMFRLWLAPGASADVVRGAVLRRLGAERGYYVVTAGQFLDRARSAIRGFFVATWAMQVVAALVGVIGVVNAQLATVLDRASEIRTLRTIGVSRRDITRSTLTECAILGALGGLGGIALGAMLSAEVVTVALRLVTGWRLPFTLSVGPLLGGVAAAALVSAVAGWVPARAAAEIELRRVPLD